MGPENSGPTGPTGPTKKAISIVQVIATKREARKNWAEDHLDGNVTYDDWVDVDEKHSNKRFLFQSRRLIIIRELNKWLNSWRMGEVSILPHIYPPHGFEIGK